ncbi:MAG: urea ABC transporter permease subunit UrtB [Alphaproteobacteria bacterium]|nr:urea ABC transporter permease subunit UrtB [Alphaproteobacteria bacterium]
MLTVWCLSLFAPVANAQEPDLQAIIQKLATSKNFNQTKAVVAELAATGDASVAGVLNALSEGAVYFRKSDRQVFVVPGRGNTLELFDPLTGEAAGEAGKRELTKVRVNNSLRRSIRDAIGGLTLASEDPTVRLNAANTLAANPDVDALPAIEAALEKETDEAVAMRLRQAQAAATLISDRTLEEKTTAVTVMTSLGNREALAFLTRFEAQAEGELKTLAASGITKIEKSLKLWGMGQNIWYGVSLGSVLLLAAIGLAITFGVMGVINMAHGEMVMLGAYTTYLVQEIIRNAMPELMDWSLLIALPLAFMVSALVGLVLERGVIRFLYGRPLETLLATWGVSLILQQAVRTLFGPSNQEVSNPSWMSGAFEVGLITITWNRLYILIFALCVFAILLWAFNKTSLGLQMRAVTQNRRMASAMGIRTPWVDALTFMLGSGIAGIAGVALSQIDNVSPNLGQSYIIDSFMVVVFGGVGNLWGTLVGALSLGVFNKFLEPYAGAVLAKILVLVFIILFIQKKPRGLFALKGRAIET